MTDLSARFPLDPVPVTAPRGSLPVAPLAMPAQQLETDDGLLRRLAAALLPRPVPSLPRKGA